MFDVTEDQQTAGSGMPVPIMRPKEPGEYPLLVLLHERYGLNRHTLELAQRLASEGYVVAAPHLFHGFSDQGALSRGEAKVEPEDSQVLAQLEEAISLSEATGSVKKDALGIIGVCQTGRYPFVYGGQRPLQAAVVLYGAANDKGKPGAAPLEEYLETMDSPVLGIFAEKDHVISIDQILEFRRKIELNNLTYQISVYRNAPHGWLNDTMPGRYRAEAAAIAWEELTRFVGGRLGQESSDATDVTWQFNCAKSSDYDFSSNVRQE